MAWNGKEWAGKHLENRGFCHPTSLCYSTPLIPQTNPTVESISGLIRPDFGLIFNLMA
jgi:hypothetical protein